MKEKIKIGVVGPFSGPRSVYGQMLIEGVNRAKLNYADNIEWVYQDDKGDPNTIKDISKEMIESGVVAVIGHFNSACALKAIPFYSKAKIPFLVPASTNLEVTLNSEELVFRFCSNDLVQAETVINFLKTKDIQTITAVSDETFYGKSLADLLYQSANSLFKEVTRIEDFNSENNKHSDAIFFAGTHFNSATYLRELRMRGYKGIFIASDDSYVDEFIELAQDYSNDAFTIKAKEDYVETSFLAASYLLECIESNVENLINELATGNSTIKFSSNGDRLGASWIIAQVIDKSFVEVNYHKTFS
ncbi:branched-chain amino acid ABC transporter substrate-binding protein [Bacillus toyonensis]|uniref:branched-chain amino acid ABC transporter substrate-binding protein n=1 Tax=Bacillus toyonensis TaxID=155322 RepID=UPI002FFF9B15